MSSPRKARFPGRTLIALCAFGLIPAGLARAQSRFELTPSLWLSQEYDSDVLHDERREESDLITRVRPQLGLAQEAEWGHARLDLSLERRMYQDLDEFDATDWTAVWDGEREITQRLRLLSSVRYELFENQDAVTEGSQTIVEGRPDQRARALAGGLRYALSPASSLELRAGFDDRDYSLDGLRPANSRRDRDTRYGILGYRQMLGPRDEVGLQLTAARTDFENIGAGDVQDDILSFRGSWTRTWNPRWASSLNAGLRSLNSETLSGSDRSVGFVGGAELTRSFRRGSLRLAYDRQTRPSSGLGTSLDQDIVTAELRTRMSDRVTLRLDAELSRLRSASETLARVAFPFSNPGLCLPGSLGVSGSLLSCVVSTDEEIDIDSRRFGAELSWRVRKRWNTFVSYRFSKQSSSGDRRLSDFDSHRVMIGFRVARPVSLR
ncbi:MAG: outer membrane beta-barrel protein [Myxococcota bacterium]